MFISKKKYKELLERICDLELMSRVNRRRLDYYIDVMAKRDKKINVIEESLSTRINAIEASLSANSNASKIELGVREGVHLASK